MTLEGTYEAVCLCIRARFILLRLCGRVGGRVCRMGGMACGSTMIHIVM